MSERIGMVSLGCAKNQVNAEQMLFLLQEAGYDVTGNPDGCDLAIVNTCGFIDSAKQEAIDNILALGELKEAGRLGKILVTGCLAQRYQEDFSFGSTGFGSTFTTVLIWTLVWAFFATFLNYFLGMVVAMLINKKGIKFKKLWSVFSSREAATMR